MLDIGLEVKILRERLQMSAKELAEKIGLSQSQMSRLEKGQRRIDTSVLAKIAAALGVAPSHFFPGSEVPADGVIPPSRPTSAGKLIRAERRRRHISAEDLAAKIGLPKYRILDVEEGKRQLDPDVAERVAKALRLPVNTFLVAQQDTIATLETQIERLNQALAEGSRGTVVDDGHVDAQGRQRRGVPVLSTLAGGYPSAFDALGRPTAEPDDFVYLPGVQDPTAFALLVVGDSMTAATPPSFSEGDLIVCADGSPRSRDFAFVHLRAEPDPSVDTMSQDFFENPPGWVTFRQVFYETSPDSRIRLQPLNLDHAATFHHRSEILGMWRLIAHVSRF